ncbi:MAG TPA: hypothetical protein VJV79_30740, partial [Polyangiaceae bacterium]|nr:hypothetical protein [Polyangiaceae bacterium]
MLLEEIERELGDCATAIGDAAGMHLAVLLAGKRDDREIAAKAALQSILVSPLSDLYLGDVRRQGLVLGFGNTR